MLGWHHWLNGHEFEKTPENSEGQGSLVCCSPWARKDLDTTEWLNNNIVCMCVCVCVCVKCIFKSCPLFIAICLIFKLQEFFSSLQILDMSFFGCMCWRYFLLICVLYFHFLSGSFVSSESFDFNKFQFISFYGWGYGLSTKFWPALKSRKIPTFSSRSFTSLDFTLGNWPTLSLFLCTVWVVSKILFFPLFQYPGVPALPNDSSVLSSSNYLDTFVKDQWILYMLAYFLS